jgi:hypothetical protein
VAGEQVAGHPTTDCDLGRSGRNGSLVLSMLAGEVLDDQKVSMSKRTEIKAGVTSDIMDLAAPHT